MAKRHKVMWVSLSSQREDGSRVTLSKNELCSCVSMGDAQLIVSLLRERGIRGRTENRKTARPDENMYFLTIE